MKRGRGTLVIGDSANPFYQTSKGACDKTLMMSVGGGMQQPVPRGAGGAAAAEYGERAEGKADVTDFMYRTSSGCYGTNVAPSGNKLAEAMDGPALQPAGSCNPTVTRAYTMEVESKLEMETPSWQAPDRVEKMAGGWQQEQTTQHPMYQTSAHAIGVKPPTVTELGAIYMPVTNKFTHSFNLIKFRDQGLNTAVSVSKVHASVGGVLS